MFKKCVSNMGETQAILLKVSIATIFHKKAKNAEKIIEKFKLKLLKR